MIARGSAVAATPPLTPAVEAQLGHAATFLERLSAPRQRRVGHEIDVKIERLLGLGVFEPLGQQLTRLDAALSRAQDQLFTAPADLIEDYQAGARRARVLRDELHARLAVLDATPPPAQEVDPERFRRFWSLCQAVVSGKVVAEGGALNEVLKELVERFTLFFKRDSRDRATLDRVEVELPPWLSELVSRATRT